MCFFVTRVFLKPFQQTGRLIFFLIFLFLMFDHLNSHKDHGYFDQWSEWGKFIIENDDETKLVQNRTRNCLSKWSPDHSDIDCDPNESIKDFRHWNIHQNCELGLKVITDRVKIMNLKYYITMV